MPPAEAEAAQARRTFGNVVAAPGAPSSRPEAMEVWADQLALDLRYAARGSLRRSPIFTAAAVGLARLGIGANTAVFSFVNALLLRPYAFPELDALVTLWERHPQQGGQASVRPSDAGHPLAPADFLELRRKARSFEGWRRSARATSRWSAAASRSGLWGCWSRRALRAAARGAALGRTLLPGEAEAGPGRSRGGEPRALAARLGGARTRSGGR